MAGDLIKYFRKKYGIEKMSPELRDEVIGKLKSYSEKQLLHEVHTTNRSVIYLVELLWNPNYLQRKALFVIYERADSTGYMAMSSLAGSIGVKLSKMNGYLPISYLKYLGIVDTQKSINPYGAPAIKFRGIEEEMKAYWKDIREWPKNNYEPENGPGSGRMYGHRIKQALQILKKKSVDDLTEEDVKTLDKWCWTQILKDKDISSSSVGSLKKNLLKRIKLRNNK